MTPKEALETIKETYIHNEYGESRGSHYDFGIECCETIEIALDELNDYRHNYKALKEFYDNSVAYGSKIQNELNELKRDVARFRELDYRYEWLGFLKDDELAEYESLKEKLSKVGKEE